jgi:negative regulator of flagellin synthesis FlgM
LLAADKVSRKASYVKERGLLPMEITNKIPPIKIDAYVHQTQDRNMSRGTTTQDSKSALKEDRVELSQTARDVQKARAQMEEIPDIREEKVTEIKNQIQNGTYEIDSHKIASKMIRQSLMDEKI